MIEKYIDSAKALFSENKRTNSLPLETVLVLLRKRRIKSTVFIEMVALSAISLRRVTPKNNCNTNMIYHKCFSAKCF